jgi:hypothetical protein
MAQREVQGTDWLSAVNDNFDELYTAGAGQAASATQSGTVELATDAEAITGTDTERALTPANLAAAATTHVDAASATAAGKVELATDAEAITGTDTARAVTPANVTAVLAASAPIAGTYTADGDDDTANAATIDTGKSTATVFIVQVYRAGVMVMEDAAVSMASGVITVADGAATYAVTTGDVINWIAF